MAFVTDMHGNQIPVPDLPQPQSAAELLALLCETVTQTDNVRRKAVDRCIERSMSKPQVLVFFVDILSTPSNPQDPNASVVEGARQLAAVLLRKKILTLWRTLDAAHQATLKATLLQLLGAEPNRHVKRSVTALACSLASIMLRDDESFRSWPELYSAIDNAGQAADAQDRLLAMTMTYELCIAICNAAEHAPKRTAGGEYGRFLRTVLERGLQDPDRATRVLALQTTGEVFANASSVPSLKQSLVEALLPHVVTTIQQNGAADAGVEAVSAALRGMDTLESLLEMQGKAQIPHVVRVAGFLFEMAGSAALHPRLREESTELLSTLVASRPRLLVKRDLVGDLIRLGLRLMAEDTIVSTEELSGDADRALHEGDEDGSEPDDEEDLELNKRTPPTVYGGRLLAAMGKNLPSKLVFNEVWSIAQRAVLPTTPPLECKASIIALAAISEGRYSALRRRLPELLALVRRLAQHAEPFVREAAGFAMCMFSDNLQPDILSHHADIMPMLLERLDDPAEKVRSRAARTLDHLCEHLGADVEPYVTTLLQKLVQILPGSSMDAQFNICGAISSICQTQSASAVALGPALLNVLGGPLQQPFATRNAMLLRARVTEAVGVVAAAMGGEAFQPFLQPSVAAALEGLLSHVDHRTDSHRDDAAELREACFGFFSNIAEAYGPLMPQDLLKQIVDAATDIIDDDSYMKSQTLDPLGKDKATTTIGDGTNGGDDDEGDDSDGDDDGETGGMRKFRVPMTELELKCAAVYCLGVLADRTRTNFTPFRAQVEDCLSGALSHFYEGVKEGAVDALTEAIISRRYDYADASGAMPWLEAATRQGSALTAENSFGARLLPPELGERVDFLVSELIDVEIKNRSDSDIRTAVCNALTRVLSVLGSPAVHVHLEPLVQALMEVINPMREAGYEDDEEGDNHPTGFGDADQYDEAGGASGGDEEVDDEDSADDGHGDEEEDDDDDEIQRRNDMYQAAGTTVDALAKAYGPYFAPYFSRIARRARKQLCAPRLSAERQIAGTSTLAAIEHLGAATEPFAQGILEIAEGLVASRITRSGLEEDSAVVVCNCCVMLKHVIENVAHLVDATIAQRVLAVLHQVFVARGGDPAERFTGAGDADEAAERAVDNAVSCVATLVRRCAPVLPLETILTTVLPYLPMRFDSAETTNAAQLLAYLAETDATRALIAGAPALAVAFLAACARTLSCPVAADEEAMTRVVAHRDIGVQRGAATAAKAAPGSEYLAEIAQGARTGLAQALRRTVMEPQCPQYGVFSQAVAAVRPSRLHAVLGQVAAM